MAAAVASPEAALEDAHINVGMAGFVPAAETEAGEIGADQLVRRNPSAPDTDAIARRAPRPSSMA